MNSKKEAGTQGAPLGQLTKERSEQTRTGFLVSPMFNTFCSDHGSEPIRPAACVNIQNLIPWLEMNVDSKITGGS